jgi:eukaryotic-like serine/threonine-protein kinase
MGEVYKARDTRLDRTVAVKILPSHLSENTEAKQRFDREARMISSLSHPNICTLHDVGSRTGSNFPSTCSGAMYWNVPTTMPWAVSG